MGTPGHVGMLHPDHTVTIRYVHLDATLDYLPFAIARIRWVTFAQDTTATIEALLAHDWSHLDPTTHQHTPPHGGVAVPGVGVSMPEPATQKPHTGRPPRLDIPQGLLFLLDPRHPHRLFIRDHTGRDALRAPVFDLSIGEHVIIDNAE